jgi:RNA polymerase sigma factor (sigma-70 family)
VKLVADHTIEAFKNGNATAFSELYTVFYPRLRFFAFKIIRNAEDAGDIVSQVFIKLWERRQRFETLANIKAFLYITTRNDSLLFLRHGNSEKKKEDQYKYFLQHDINDLLEEMVKTELFSELYKELEALPEKHKSILKRFYIDGATTLQVAMQMNMEIGAVKMMKLRALRLLRERLKNRHLLSLVILIIMYRA